MNILDHPQPPLASPSPGKQPHGKRFFPGWLDRHEISGSLGDMGTFLPLLIGMASQDGLNFASALFFAGFFNIVTGFTFGIPMAVQPMKAIAAVSVIDLGYGISKRS